MDAEQIALRRKLLNDKANALKELHILGDLDAEGYAREMVTVQRQRRRLKDLANKAATQETANLPAVIKSEGRGRAADSTPEQEKTSQNDNSSKDSISPNGVAPPRLSEEWWAIQKPQTQSHRCKRIKRNGQRCRRLAWTGTTVCGHHGAKAPQVKQAAMNRIALASDRMAANLLGMATDAESEVVRLRATDSALDRAGITKPTQIEVGPKPHEEIFTEIFSGSRTESRRARGVEDSSNSIADQSFTEIGGYAKPAPAASADPGQSQPRPTSRDSDCGPLAAPQSDEHPRPRRSRYDMGVLTGEEAIYSANAENANQDYWAPPYRERRALPPGNTVRR